MDSEGTGGRGGGIPGGGTPYGPLQRRLLGIAGGLAALMIGLIVFHALHTGQTGLNAVAEAAERTASRPGGKLAMEVTYTLEGLPGQTAPRSVVGNGSGAYNARTGRTRATLTVPTEGRGPVSIVSVGDGQQVFLRSSAFAGELPVGKEWLGMEPFLGHDPQTAFGSSGGKSQLELLRAVGGGVEKLDQQTVRGHLTTRYKGSIDLAKAAHLLAESGETAVAREYERFAERIPGPIPVEAWIDDRGLARQIRIVENLPTTPGGPTLSMDMRVQYYDFGAQPKIEFPPARRVFDTTPVLRAELGLEDGSTVGPLTPPTGTKALAAGAFHSRARAICRSMTAQAKAFLADHPDAVTAMRSIHSEIGSPIEAHRAFSATGFLFERFSALARKGTERLARLSPPAALAADFRRLQLINAKEAEWTLALGRASQLGPAAVASLKSRISELSTEEAESHRLEKRLGIPCASSAPSASGDVA